MRKTVLFALAAIVAAPAGSAQAQVMDWGPIIQSEAMGSAIAEAGREGSGARPTRRSRTASAAGSGRSNPQTRAKCARARGWAADGVRHPDLPQVLNMCRRMGY